MRHLFFAFAASVPVVCCGGEPEASREEKVPPFGFTGSLTQKYRFRKARGRTDQDLYGWFDLEGTCPGEKDGSGTAPYRVVLQGSYRLDIDSFRSPRDAFPSRFLPFLDPSNTFSARLQGFLEAAYLEGRHQGPFSAVRAGRQSIYRDTLFLFDGVWAEADVTSFLSAHAVGGVPVHFSESSPSGDSLAGGGVRLRPSRGLMLGCDYLYLRDRRRLQPLAEDNLTHLYGSLRPVPQLRLWACASYNGTRDRRQALQVTYHSADLGLAVSFHGMRQNGRVEIESAELSPFFAVQGSYAPFFQATVDVRKTLGRELEIAVGGTARRLKTERDEGLYNRQFANGYGEVLVQELWKGMRAAVQADLWDSSGDDLFSVGGELRQELADQIVLSAGTDFSLYRLDLLTGEERYRDRRYWGKIAWQVIEELQLSCEYRYERDGSEEYHTAVAEVRIWF